MPRLGVVGRCSPAHSVGSLPRLRGRDGERGVACAGIRARGTRIVLLRCAQLPPRPPRRSRSSFPRSPAAWSTKPTSSIEATRTALTQKLADLEAKTTDQLVVVTLKSLQGTSIEDFGYQLGRHWRIGQKDKNNGVLLIVVPDERKVRIEVGYGLEGSLTDAVSRLIIENAHRSALPRQ